MPKALEVKASYPSVLTIFNAASIISAFVNFAFGGIFTLPQIKSIVLHRMFYYTRNPQKVNRLPLGIIFRHKEGRQTEISHREYQKSQKNRERTQHKKSSLFKISDDSFSDYFIVAI